MKRFLLIGVAACAFAALPALSVIAGFEHASELILLKDARGLHDERACLEEDGDDGIAAGGGVDFCSADDADAARLRNGLCHSTVMFST